MQDLTPLALIPLLPLLSFGILILMGRRLGRWAPAVSLLALLGSALLSLDRYMALTLPSAIDPQAHLSMPASLHFTWAWLPFGEHSLKIGFLADPLSVTMCLVVTVIGWMIMLYSIGYMHGDPRFSRFFAYLSLFFSAMLTLVLADHFVLLYIGWEGVGLCSYLLISFWFEKPAAANAGKKAFLTTRVGDLGLLAAILLIAKLTGNLSFADLGSRAAALGHWAPWVAILIFWGAAGKSAQFPLHVWLPDAMEGPTPVSALIHAATMVAAGVYLVARTMPLFLPNPQALMTVAVIGAFTSLFAATIACTQTDLKRILAYSTLSQLGLMMLGLGTGSAFAGMFHLVTHAWFKALLFLGAGSVIHAMHHQEITRMGGLWRKMPVTATTFTLAAVAMAGIPPLSGFWSKEEILAAVHGALPLPFLAVAMAVSFLTAFYISRAVILTFFGQPREESHVHESPLVMTGPLMLLAIGSAGVGLLGSKWTGHAFQQFLGVHAAGHEAATWMQSAAIAVAGSGFLLALARYGFGWPLLPKGLRVLLRPAYRLVANKYFIDEIYEALLLNPIRRLSGESFSFDAGVIDGAVNGAGVAGLRLSRFKQWVDETIVDGLINNTALTIGRGGALFRRMQTGLVQNYLLVALGSVLAIFLLMKGLP